MTTASTRPTARSPRVVVTDAGGAETTTPALGTDPWPRSTIAWGDGSHPIHLTLDGDGPLTLGPSPLRHSGTSPAGHGIPATAAVELLVAGRGRDLTSVRLDRTAVGRELRPVANHERARPNGPAIEVVQRDASGTVETSTVIEGAAGASAYRITTTVRNTGPEPITLQAVTTSLRGLDGFLGAPDATQVWSARNEWCAESRWFSEQLTGPAGLPDINPPMHGHAGRGMLSRTSTSTWSSGEYLPVSVLANEATGRAVAWEIENNGPWRWEVTSQYFDGDHHSLALSGPTDLSHAWTRTLAPGETFTAVPVSVAFSAKGFDGAIAELTEHRRRARLLPLTPERTRLVYNDYMNTLMGNPTAERLEPLIAAAAGVGAEVFCIDAGWYADYRTWWNSVGEWLPSSTRFGDAGLAGIIAQIREAGMEPGLWIEPEVVGIHSPVADQLPPECFLHRGGVRIVEHERYFLDLRSPTTRAHLDEVFDRLIDSYGARFIKWDYNVTPGIGPDHAGGPGAGLHEHTQALLGWARRLRERHPEVTIEACASGGQRIDPATTALFDLQSTSDQQDLRRYPPIAASAPAAMVPEQAANWAYPQPEMTAEEIVFTLVTGLAGRMYLSGRLDEMDDGQLALVREAVALYPEILAHHAAAVPEWPLGLPAWTDPVVVLATRTATETLVIVWNRDVNGSRTELALGELVGRDVDVSTVFPSELPVWETAWDAGVGKLTVRADGESARILRVRARV